MINGVGSFGCLVRVEVEGVDCGFDRVDVDEDWSSVGNLQMMLFDQFSSFSRSEFIVAPLQSMTYAVAAELSFFR